LTEDIIIHTNSKRRNQEQSIENWKQIIPSEYRNTIKQTFQHITQAIFRIEIHAYKSFNFIQKKAGTKNQIMKCIKHENTSLTAALQQR
jgi:hypothetical protein